MRALYMMCIIPLLLFAMPPAPKSEPHIKGILPEVFEKASFDKKRETYKSKIKALELEKNPRGQSSRGKGYKK